MSDLHMNSLRFFSFEQWLSIIRSYLNDYIKNIFQFQSIYQNGNTIKSLSIQLKEHPHAVYAVRSQYCWM